MNAQEEIPSDEDLAIIGQSWQLTQFQFVQKVENMVFSAQRFGERVFLRLTSPLRRNRDEITAELAWIDFLHKDGLSVIRPIKNSDGHLCITAHTSKNQRFEAVVFAEVVGSHPSPETAQSPAFLFRLGSIIAKMHLSSIKCGRTFLREDWFHERGLRNARLAAETTNSHLELKSQLLASIAWMESLSKSQNNYGLVHADLGTQNLFVNSDGDITIMDFDDSCFHWFAFDLAIVIFALAARSRHERFDKTEQQWLHDLLTGYRSVRELDREEEAKIPRFIHFACLRLFFWIQSHLELETIAEENMPRIKQSLAWSKKRAELGFV